MKNLKNESKTDDEWILDPIIDVAWLPDQEVRLSEYTQMITHFVQRYVSEKLDAKPICSEEFPFRQESNPESM